jgi:dolichol-phosphate mannosyltransferase
MGRPTVGVMGSPNAVLSDLPEVIPLWTATESADEPASGSISRAGSIGDRPPSPPCVFVVPAYNEEENILRLLDDFSARPELFATAGGRVIVVDDGSSDATPKLVSEYQGPMEVELVALERNSGPGAAFRAGFAAALARCPADACIVTLEADTTSDLDALPEMLRHIVAGADLVLASWEMVDVSRRRRILSASAGFVVRRALRLSATTVSSFYRVYRSSTLRTASELYGDRLIQEPGFACKAELLAKLVAMKARVEEVTVTLDWNRRNGKSKMPVTKTMLAYWRMMFRQLARQDPA